MKFYKDYHFYVAISAFIILIVGLLTDYFGAFIDQDTVLTIVSYALSILIAFNVININVAKKDVSEIKKDIEETKSKIEESAKQIIKAEESKNTKSTKSKGKSIKKDVL